MRTIDIDYNIDDNWEDVQRFLEDMLPLLGKDGAEKEWCIDFMGCDYLGPDAAVILYSFWIRAMKLGRSVKVVLPTSPPKLDGFCRYSGLIHYINKGPRPQPDHPNSETIPLTQIYQAQWGAGLSLIRLVKRHFPTLSQESEEYLQVSLGETIQNIEDHAESPVGGIWCGRYFVNRREVRIAAVDLGIGIQTALAKEHPEITDSATALSRVLEGGWSSRSRDNNMGLGISNLAGWTRQCRGTLVLLSGDAVATVSASEQKPTITQIPFFFPGTGVFLSLGVEGTESDSNGNH